ncbi:MAG: DUF448 domain-containing protein [Candidatus Cloacimonetes bacterium]|nr:DUF448 domain-containing protein [Candidatus Cloacimonadota bacterium]MDD4099892.1 DUF448 domain-containing protein [Candidatus Cloacimonadota bacterium]MDD4806283.1 DUF448 domain-containing protein [Candidatus Cloacimonadota bacterium]
MNSSAGHIPIRTCVVCRQKSAQTELLPFILLPAGVAYDLSRRLQCRKYYHCLDCLDNLSPWLRRKSKGRKK